ncbi:hypothetical protein BwiPL1_20720 [Bacillus wiedmannii]|nr:hypothetical protein BwiPL1_20720 [Bacillus wiedmannii]
MEDFSWLQTIISAGTGILGGVIGAVLTNIANKKMHKEKIMEDKKLAIRAETLDEQKVINPKVLDFIRNNPNCVIAKIKNNVRGENKNLEEEWTNMVDDAIKHLLLEGKIEISNPEQIYAMYQEYKVK